MIEQRIYQHDEIPSDLKCQILSFLRIEWPEDIVQDPRRRYLIAPPEHHPVSIVLVESGFLVSHAAVLWKYLDHAGQTYKVYGLGGVFTYPDYRGQGYGRRMVQAGTEFIRRSDGDVAMLFCEPALSGFYAEHGWLPMVYSPTLLGTQHTSCGELRMMLFLSEKGLRSRSAFEQEPVYFGEPMHW
jgi:GNAT superfamily N-acetyltransferase